MSYPSKLVFLALLSISCQGKSDKGPIPEPPIQSLIHQEPKIVDMEKIAGRFDVSENCIKKDDHSLTVRLHTKEDRFALEISRFEDSECSKLSVDTLHKGLWKSVETGHSLNQLTLETNETLVRYYSEPPAEYKDCSEEASFPNRNVWLATTENCGLPFHLINGEQSRKVFSSPASQLELRLGDKVLGSNAGENSVSISFKNTRMVSESEISSNDEFLCKNATDRVLKDGVCEKIDFVKASDESRIEFEKETGRYPRLTGERVLAVANEEKTFLVSYRFPCETTMRGAITVGFAGQKPQYLQKKSSDAVQTLELRGTGELRLLQDHSYLMPESLRMKNSVVDLKCQLILEVKESDSSVLPQP